MSLAFTTPHGSHLYGLSHAGSDRDYMYVYMDSRRALHKHSGGLDVIHVGIYDLLLKASSGAHQFVEGVFSQKKEWHDESFRPLIENFIVPGAVVREKYERTIKSFAFGETTKHRRHAVRLALELEDLTAFGRTNPTMDIERLLYIKKTADQFDGEKLYTHLIR